MANFKQHLQYGVATSSVASVVAYAQLGLDPVQSGAACVIGIIASIAPDFDHPISTPGDFLFNCLAIILPLAIIDRYLNTKALPLEMWILFMAVGYLFVKHVLKTIFHKITVHRGMFHSIPAIILCGELIFLLFAHLEVQTRFVIAGIGMLGYLTHLAADEIYSVDWQGNALRLKKSSGSALDLGNFREYSTWVTYALVIGFGVLVFEDSTAIPVMEHIKDYFSAYTK
ncbi:metal-dependent hydrolase [Candidatus Uabimicrobium amorphum]|uniref:Hydrolase n=1 Tax=Uabimicrobium amorphum TaxID=2596890 RepID=A0A5S9F4U7_UABAM|nr:metal-dependent hydrolase [Candidatus Uabimicrobium amorphum]BBM85651.1 hydrolase [Candidatus Uabimicrobium amorphum]